MVKGRRLFGSPFVVVLVVVFVVDVIIMRLSLLPYRAMAYGIKVPGTRSNIMKYGWGRCHGYSSPWQNYNHAATTTVTTTARQQQQRRQFFFSITQRQSHPSKQDTTHNQNDEDDDTDDDSSKNGPTNRQRLDRTSTTKKRKLPIRNSTSSGTTIPSTSSFSSSPSSSKLLECIENSIQEVRRISGKKKILLTLSVSGGCDSVALFHSCMEIQGRRMMMMDYDACEIHVLHFNHQQRIQTSDDDAQFVQDLCQRYNIPYHVELWETMTTMILDTEQQHHQDPPLATATPTSLPSTSSSTKTRTLSSSSSSFSQDKARQWRRQKLQEFSIEQIQKDTMNDDDDVAGIIMTAHHQDDSMESLALKALRGVHLLNLGGIQTILPLPRSSSPSNGGKTTKKEGSDCDIYLVRPWAQNVTKCDLIEYLIQRNETWREDESNSSPKYLRNRVRNELLPLLQDMTQDRFVNVRIPTWVQQSEELLSDIQPRVENHLTLVVMMTTDDEDSSSRRRRRSFFDWTQSCKLICDPQYKLIHSPLIQSQALFQWLNGAEDEDGGSLVVTYELLQRVLLQLRSFPERQTWMIELGQGWNLKRSGDVLYVYSSTKDVDQPSIDKDETSDLTGSGSISWLASLVATNDPTVKKNSRWPVASNEMIVWVKSTTADDRIAGLFHEVRLFDYEQRKKIHTNNVDKKGSTIMFIPYWRNSNIKIRQFLRMQGIPFHRRDDTMLLVADGRCGQYDDDKDDDSTTIVAVQVSRTDGTKEWILHRDYHYDSQSEHSTISAQALRLIRQNLSDGLMR